MEACQMRRHETNSHPNLQLVGILGHDVGRMRTRRPWSRSFAMNPRARHSAPSSPTPTSPAVTSCSPRFPARFVARPRPASHPSMASLRTTSGRPQRRDSRAFARMPPEPSRTRRSLDGSAGLRPGPRSAVFANRSGEASAR
jgi:hypothetical protein